MTARSPLAAVAFALLVLSLSVPAPGFSAAPLKSLPPYVAGFPLHYPRPVDYRPQEGGVIAADLDGDGREELIASIPAGLVVAAREGGVLPGSWPRRFGDLPQPAYPVGIPGVGDLDGDGRNEVVVCVMAGAYPSTSIHLYALRADGTDLPGWPIDIPSSRAMSACLPTATLVRDLDGDGRPEVVRSIAPDEVWAFDGGGNRLTGWPFQTGPDSLGRWRSLNADLAAADLDHDGLPEVLFAESGLGPRLMAVDLQGRLVPGFPKLLPEIVDRQAPALGDIDGDGAPEIVQATLPFNLDYLRPPTLPSALRRPLSLSNVLQAPALVGTESTEPAPAIPAELHSLRHDGGELPGWPFPLGGGAAWGSLLADVDADGALEVVQGDGDQIHALTAGGTEASGFPIAVHRGFTKSPGESRSQWLLADFDADGRPEFVQARSNIDAGAMQLRLLAERAGGGQVRGFPFTLDGVQAASQPVAVDLTGDGVPEVAILVIWGTTGGWNLLAWDVARPEHGHAVRNGISTSAVFGQPVVAPVISPP